MLWGERVRRGRAFAFGILFLGAVAVTTLAVVVLSGGSGRAAPVALPLHPLAGTFSPDATSLQDCDAQPCFEQALGNVAYREGPKAALALVPTVYGDGASPYCHRAVHAIGAAALARNQGSVARTFAEGDATCWSGYYHGVLERSLVGIDSHDPNALAAVARTLCDEAKRTMTPWVAYQCLHGLGHGLMITTGLHLPRSLAVCRRLATQSDRSACKGGVFMENLSSSYGYRSRWLHDDDPVYPCNAVRRSDKHRCYQMVTTHVISVFDGDWERTAKTCSRVERDFVATCFGSFGRDASSRSARDPGAIVRTCSVARPYGGEGDCIEAAASDMTANDTSPNRARGLCEAVTGELVARCYSGVGQVLAAFRKTEAMRERDCRALVSDEPLVAACIEAGRGPQPNF